MRWAFVLVFFACGGDDAQRQVRERAPEPRAEVEALAPEPEPELEPETSRRADESSFAANLPRSARVERAERLRRAEAEPGAGVSRGRMLAAEGRLEEALVAFEEAIDADPEDPIARCEASFAALRLERNVVALHHAERGAALGGARPPAARARCLFNLGRAHEALGQLAAASSAYARSLGLREHETVRARLDELESGECAPARRFESLDALCAHAIVPTHPFGSCLRAPGWIRFGEENAEEVPTHVSVDGGRVHLVFKQYVGSFDSDQISAWLALEADGRWELLTHVFEYDSRVDLEVRATRFEGSGDEVSLDLEREAMDLRADYAEVVTRTRLRCERGAEGWRCGAAAEGEAIGLACRTEGVVSARHAALDATVAALRWLPVSRREEATWVVAEGPLEGPVTLLGGAGRCVARATGVTSACGERTRVRLRGCPEEGFAEGIAWTGELEVSLLPTEDRELEGRFEADQSDIAIRWFEDHGHGEIEKVHELPGFTVFDAEDGHALLMREQAILGDFPARPVVLRVGGAFFALSEEEGQRRIVRIRTESHELEPVEVSLDPRCPTG